jgi:hypothetical protein
MRDPGVASAAIQHRIARRRAEEEGGDTLFRPQVTTKSAATKRDPREASAAIQHRIARRRAEEEGGDTLFRPQVTTK